MPWNLKPERPQLDLARVGKDFIANHAQSYLMKSLPPV